MPVRRESEETDREKAFHALADATRRQMLEMLVAGDRTATDLAKPFAMTQPAVSQHLKILRDANLVTVTAIGRQRLYRVKAEPLRLVFEWVKPFAQFWDEKLGSLGLYLDQQAKEKQKRKRRRHTTP